MADSTAQLRRKIGSAADLQSVVRAMKAQAAASVGQYAASVAAIGDYVRNVELGLGACFRHDPLTAAPSSLGPWQSPVGRPGERMAAPQGGRPAAAQRAIRAVVFGSDQGLVGRFNDSVAEHATQALLREHPDTRVWAVGERMRATLADGVRPPQGTFAVPASVQAITHLVTDILLTVVDPMPTATGSGGPSELHLFYNRPTTGAAYAPTGQRLLPLDDAWRRQLAARPWPTHMPAEIVGSPADTMRSLISEFVFVSIFSACAASLASENASRLAAMDRADRNIDKMLLTLHDRFHRLRQRRIDEELSDVISGFKALHRQIRP